MYIGIMQVSQTYRSNFRKLDRKFAADVVGDGSGAAVGPFEAAQVKAISFDNRSTSLCGVIRRNWGRLR